MPTEWIFSIFFGKVWFVSVLGGLQYCITILKRRLQINRVMNKAHIYRTADVWSSGEPTRQDRDTVPSHYMLISSEIWTKVCFLGAANLILGIFAMRNRLIKRVERKA